MSRTGCNVWRMGGWAVEGRLIGLPYHRVMKRYERLEAWQAAHQLVLLTYRVTKSFPREELYGLTSQARRAAFSVAANIAEGSAKKGPREFRRYLDIAVGSLSELSYIFQLVKDLDLIEPTKWSELDQARERAGRMGNIAHRPNGPSAHPPIRPSTESSLPPARQSLQASFVRRSGQTGSPCRYRWRRDRWAGASSGPTQPRFVCRARFRAG